MNPVGERMKAGLIGMAISSGVVAIITLFFVALNGSTITDFSSIQFTIQHEIDSKNNEITSFALVFTSALTAHWALSAIVAKQSFLKIKLANWALVLASVLLISFNVDIVHSWLPVFQDCKTTVDPDGMTMTLCEFNRVWRDCVKYGALFVVIIAAMSRTYFSGQTESPA